MGCNCDVNCLDDEDDCPCEGDCTVWCDCDCS